MKNKIKIAMSALVTLLIVGVVATITVNVLEAVRFNTTKLLVCPAIGLQTVQYERKDSSHFAVGGEGVTYLIHDSMCIEVIRKELKSE